MPSLIWTPRALADLDRLHDFLAQHDPDAARRAVRAIREGMRLVVTHPEAGRPARGMTPEYRERWIGFGRGGYLVLYRLGVDRTAVIAVRHGREAGYR